MSEKCSSISLTVYSHNLNYDRLLGVHQRFPLDWLVVLLALLYLG